MARGLARKNNLSDLENAEQARVNLGLALQITIAFVDCLPVLA